VAIAETLRRLQEEAKATIRATFATTEVPGPSEVENNHCEWCHASAARFAGLRWTEISVATPIASAEAVNQLPAPGLLPVPRAAHAHVHRGPSGIRCLPASLISNLSPPNAKASGRNRDGKATMPHSTTRNDRGAVGAASA
jgi:hypothetical protein